MSSTEKETPKGTHVEGTADGITQVPLHDGTISSAAGRGQVATDK